MTLSFAERLKKTETTLQLLWFALTATIPMYAVVAFIIVKQNASTEPAFHIPNTVILGLVVAATFASMVVSRNFLNESRLKAFLHRDPSTQIKPMLEGLNAQEQTMLRVPGWAMVPLLIRWALHESVAVLGLLVSIGQSTLKESWVLFVVALILNVLAYPRFAEYYSMAKRIHS